MLRANSREIARDDEEIEPFNPFLQLPDEISFTHHLLSISRLFPFRRNADNFATTQTYSYNLTTATHPFRSMSSVRSSTMERMWFLVKTRNWNACAGRRRPARGFIEGLVGHADV
jgi:hypothetical protein